MFVTIVSLVGLALLLLFGILGFALDYPALFIVASLVSVVTGVLVICTGNLVGLTWFFSALTMFFTYNISENY